MTKNNRHTRNTICHKCKEYGHTKKQCNRHNKIVKQISKLEFEKDVINELMEMFDVIQKEIDQVTKKEELKSTNPLKVNKRKRKQKDIIIKLKNNLPNHLKDKKRLFTKIERFYRHTYCLFLSVGNMDTMLRNEVRKKKLKKRKKQKKKEKRKRQK